MLTVSVPTAERVERSLQRQLTRRGLFPIATAFIAAIAALADYKSAAADTCGWGCTCCDLATCTLCSVQQCGGWYCPTGYYQTLWTCVSGGRTWMCGECSANRHNCDLGPWYCSICF